MLFISFSDAEIIPPPPQRLFTWLWLSLLHCHKIKRSFVLLFIFFHRKKRLFNASSGDKHRPMPRRRHGRVKKSPKRGPAWHRALAHSTNDDASAVNRPETFPISPLISRLRLLTAHWHIMIYQSAATGGATSLPSAIYLIEMIFVRSYIAASTASP